MNDTDNNLLPSWYPALIEWIHNAGGHVHEFLELRGVGTTQRGIVCTGGAIQKGDLLIRLPVSLALSGQDLPGIYDGNKIASPWLRCIAALYQAASNHTPYIDSLPSEYETLFQWSNDQVSKYLGGTAIARVLETDRKTKMLETRYSTAVRPYLEYLSISPVCCSSDEWERFRQACMCVSTRGFHMQSSDDSFSGPFLLPWIDLMNHNPVQSCTTLKRDSHNNFVMIAERNVVKGEQIFHSYGNNLSSGQCLQTFGFVPQESIQQAISNTVGENVTPAVLSRADIIKACQEMVQSGYPEQLRSHVESHLCGEEVWDISIHEDRDLDLVSNELLVCHKSPLSDELVTLVCLVLLPHVAYRDFMEDSPSLLDSSILQDYFLGKLACRTLLIALKNKKKTYPANATASNLSILYEKEQTTVTEQRAMYGWSICMEEKACLEALRKHVLEIMDSLDDNEEEMNYPGASKRRRDD